LLLQAEKLLAIHSWICYIEHRKGKAIETALPLIVYDFTAKGGQPLLFAVAAALIFYPCKPGKEGKAAFCSMVFPTPTLYHNP